MKTQAAILTGALLLVAAGCGSNSSISNDALHPSPVNTPNAASQSAKVSIHIPAPPQSQAAATAFRRFYVGPGTDTVWISLYAINGIVQSSPVVNQFVLNANPSPCTTNTDGSKDCTFLIQDLPAGRDTFAIVAAHSHNPLGFVDGVSATIGGGVVASISATLDGVVVSLGLNIASQADANHTDLSFVALDDNGNLIGLPGSYAQPITLQDSDPSGQTGIMVNGSAPATTATVKFPTDKVVFYNTGAASVDLQVTGSGPTFIVPSTEFPGVKFGVTPVGHVAAHLNYVPGPAVLEMLCSSTGCIASGSASVGIN